MNYLPILFAVIFLLLVYELFKRHFFQKILKFVIACLILFIILMVAASFVDTGKMFGKDNLISKTGAVIVRQFEKNLESREGNAFLNATEIVDSSAELIEEKFIKK